MGYFEQPTVSPLSEPRKRRLPAKERQQRKKQSNKESSRRYRQKVKNRQNDLLSSLEELTQKKRAIELDLAKTKAVNSFLVEQLRNLEEQFEHFPFYHTLLVIYY